MTVVLFKLYIDLALVTYLHNVECMHVKIDNKIEKKTKNLIHFTVPLYNMNDVSSSRYISKVK